LSVGRAAQMVLVAVIATAASGQEAKPPTQKPPASKPAPEPSTVTDDEFLEFLGSVDSTDVDGDWMEYLSQTDIAKVARAKKESPPAPEVKK